MLFHMLQKYANIKHAIINDINLRLIKTYLTIRSQPHELITELSAMRDSYFRLPGDDARKDCYLEARQRFNEGQLTDLQTAALMIFLNRTCFNGLYRENSRGDFNVPIGKYKNPLICDAELIIADSKLLQRVTILHGDFSQTAAYAKANTFIYCDPPYRPLNATSCFNSYVKTPFNDGEQLRLKEFIDSMNDWGCQVMLSNSDGHAIDPDNRFFDDLYDDYIIERVIAKRAINANPLQRGNMSELLIRNYQETLAYNHVIL